MKDLVTKESLKAMLDIDKFGHDYVEQVVGRALWAIFKRQTDSERTSNVTNTENGIGFTGSDAHGGSITAKYWKKNGNLGYSKGEHWRLEKWTKPNAKGDPRICKYVKQLNEIANEKDRIANLPSAKSHYYRMPGA